MRGGSFVSTPNASLRSTTTSSSDACASALPDDYADRYLPEILARFSRSNPRAEVTVVCEPSPNLIERVQNGDLDLAIITHVDRRGPSEIVRVEQLLWVTSARHAVHEENPAAARARPPDLRLAPLGDRSARERRRGLIVFSM